MAEDKKDKKKPAEAKPVNTANEIIFLLAGLLILGVIVGRLAFYLESRGWGTWEMSWARILDLLFWPFWPAWKVVAVVLSVICVLWAAYSYKKLQEVVKEEEKRYGLAPVEPFLEELKNEAPMEKKNEKWLRVMQHTNSDNPADWRLAVIEADVMLEEALRLAGYHGDSVGDMLKSAGPGDIANIEAAWEAHKVRNRIAHAGGDFQLNERETRRVIALFETVFLEFGII